MNCLTKDKIKYKKALMDRNITTSQIETLNRNLTRHKSDCFDLIQKEEFKIDVHNEYMSNYNNKIKEVKDEKIEYSKIINDYLHQLNLTHNLIK